MVHDRRLNVQYWLSQLAQQRRSISRLYMEFITASASGKKAGGTARKCLVCQPFLYSTFAALLRCSPSRYLHTTERPG